MGVPCQDQPNVNCGFPYFPNEVYYTESNTPYFKECGAALIAMPQVNLNPIRAFLSDFDDSLGLEDYLSDPVSLDSGATIAKFAGQNCYQSFGEARTWNKDADRYFANIRNQKHWSVIEHASYTFLFWGVDRSLTHELVRHRHFSFSQLSQRYCDGKSLRFVERPEYQPERLQPDASSELCMWVGYLHREFEINIDRTAREYDVGASSLSHACDEGHVFLRGVSKTERRKHMNQVARELLPNCTEAPIVVSGNARSWREFIDKRATAAADVPIRELAVKVLKCLQHVSPLLFGDYEITSLDNGTEVAKAWEGK